MLVRVGCHTPRIRHRIQNRTGFLLQLVQAEEKALHSRLDLGIQPDQADGTTTEWIASACISPGAEGLKDERALNLSCATGSTTMVIPEPFADGNREIRPPHIHA